MTGIQLIGIVACLYGSENFLGRVGLVLGQNFRNIEKADINYEIDRKLTRLEKTMKESEDRRLYKL